MKFDKSIPGHWSTQDGVSVANHYVDLTREHLAMSAVPDLELANAIFLASRHDVDLIVFQTAAKERIRWLSVQLAARDAALIKAEEKLKSMQERLIEMRAWAEGPPLS